MDDTADIVDAEVVDVTPPPDPPEPGTDLEVVETPSDVDVPPEETIYAWATDIKTYVETGAARPAQQTTGDAPAAARGGGGGGGGASASKGKRRRGGGGGSHNHFALIDLSGLFSGLFSGWLSPRATVASGNRLLDLKATTPTGRGHRGVKALKRDRHVKGVKW